MNQKSESQNSVDNAEVAESITGLSNFIKLYRVVRRIKTSKHILLVFFTVLIVFSTFNFLGKWDFQDLSKTLIDYSNDLITWTISILGFILAGYSIYATLTDKELNLALASVTNTDYGVSYLVFSHAVFIKVIIEITVIGLLAFMVQVIVDSALIKSLVTEGGNSKFTILLFIFLLTLIQSLFTYILMSCLVFIYNVYHNIMTSIRWFAENKLEKSQTKKPLHITDNRFKNLTLQSMRNKRSSKK